MRRVIWCCFLLACLCLALSACHETGDDTSSTTSTSPDSGTALKEGDTADLGGVKVIVVKSDMQSSQLVVSVRVENQSSGVVSLKSSSFTATDSENTIGLPTTCGGRGGFSGELAVGDKIDSTVCWFMVGAKPPITVTFAAGGHKASFTLAVQ